MNTSRIFSLIFLATICFTNIFAYPHFDHHRSKSQGYRAFNGKNEDNNIENSDHRAGIRNGKNADFGEAPYQVAVLVNSVFKCGGVFISNSSVLTLAQCTDGVNPNSIKVRYGTNLVNKSNYTDVDVTSFTQHKDYNSKTFENDISMLHLTRNISDKDAKQILLEPTPLADNTDVTIYGWGITSNNTTANELQKADLKIINQTVCRDTWAKYGWTVTDGMICAMSSTQSACYNDGGGPMVSPKKLLVGLISWGPRDCQPGVLMDVFTRISSYSAWINQALIL